MKILRTLAMMLLVLLMVIPLIPLTVLLDQLSGNRDYTIKSVFVDIWVILKDIWKNRSKA